MSKIAVIKTGGKQYKVREGQILRVEKLDAEKGDKVELETLMIADTEGKDLEMGTPVLDKKIPAKVLEIGKGKKVNVVKYKNKTRYKRTLGHRQMFSQIEIGKI